MGVPVGDDMGHEYDGIRELNNDLPNGGATYLSAPSSLPLSI
ncbi:cytochrome c oxidase subunit ccoP [Vibrio sp. JCM 19236]|nr:cytochrome c oxidase subunit ccoP [Vibrio sp. JCM 19236]